ncbi:acyl-CoA thioesterase [Corallococcus sp. H22C18031201]|uniref:acyl-CoA thioesterase n=1 Tax=Citreicoccus inhibens TaxID=2849499 RepID=UPI000E7149BC|nr:thioesterase family protein [Citreicoccus inhibens]MBU8899813.1 acyl-CoA thioesterase [Citreicoccus inhibens]RJS22011.1 acyl-CoA thioesterase [Corallococcus sp. H22C18031201]
MSASPLENFPIVVPFTVHWSEMDAFGHVNNARTFTWFESARIAYLARIGLTGPTAAGADTAPGGVGPILATTQADYLRPVVFPARLVAGARVTRIGNASITFEHAVAGEEDGVLYTRGSSVIVTLRYAAHEKVPVPQPIRAAIEALEGRSFSPASDTSR